MIAAALSLSSMRSDTLQSAPRQLSNTQCPTRSFIHEVTPSQRIETYAEADEMASEPTAKNFSRSHDVGSERRTLQHSFTTYVSDPAKVVARKASANPDTVEAHRQSVPKSWEQLVRYARAYPMFALEVAEAMGLDLDRDRDTYARFLELQRSIRGGS